MPEFLLGLIYLPSIPGERNDCALRIFLDFQKFKDVLADSTSSVPDLYFAAQGLKDLNQAVPHTDVVKTIQTALKTDDTLVK